MPTFSDMVTLFDGFIWVFGLIFGLAAGLGVMNTMLMATHERVREFGLIKALGGTPWRIVRDVAAEAIVLAFVGTAWASSPGLRQRSTSSATGIDTSRWAGSFSVGGVAFDPVWRARHHDARDRDLRRRDARGRHPAGAVPGRRSPRGWIRCSAMNRV